MTGTFDRLIDIFDKMFMREINYLCDKINCLCVEINCPFVEVGTSLHLSILTTEKRFTKLIL